MPPLAGFSLSHQRRSGYFYFPAFYMLLRECTAWAAIYLKGDPAMIILEITLALLAEFPSFVDIVVRHALGIIGAM